MHPDKVGPYLITRKIGSGGMGNVYLGRHEDTGHEVAVKVLPASMAREEGFVLRFSREIEALRKLQNEHIVELFEDGQTDEGSYYYSMEFVDGETLTSMISRRRKIPWREVVDISLEIAIALKAAHDAGIIHRDLKPSNLMVRNDGQIKLTDFGVAHVFATTRLTRTGGVVGTAEYMSPEQARGKRATRHSDLYSLGAVMYVMLTGRPPFTGKLASDILHKHQFSQFDKPSNYVPDIPRLVEEYVCRLLEKKPESRFPDALVAIRQLQNVRSRVEFEEKVRSEESLPAADSSSDHTVGGTSDKTRVSEASSEVLENRPGPATIVRDVIREDFARQRRKSPVQQFFDNTYVLIGMFALVVAVGFYMFRENAGDPAKQYAEVETIMQEEAGPGWVRARESLHQLVSDGTLPDKEAQMKLWMSQVDHYEFCRRLKVTSPTDGSAESEIQRLVRQATDAYLEGRVAAARTRLRAVQNIVAGDPAYSYLNEFISATLGEWEHQDDAAAPRLLLKSIVAKARERLQSDVADPRARRMLTAGVMLYSQEESVSDAVEECQQLLDAMPAEGS